MKRLRRFLARVAQWLLGPLDDATQPAAMRRGADQPPIAMTPDEVRKQVTAATGIPIENVVLIPMQRVVCGCPKCRARRGLAARYTPSNN